MLPKTEKPQKGEYYRLDNVVVKVEFTTDNFVVVSGWGKPEDETSIHLTNWEKMGWERIDEHIKS